MNQSDQFLLQSVWEPRVVATPPADAWRDLCRLPDGEIRHYGQIWLNGRWQRIYLQSRNEGLSWETVVEFDENAMGAMVKSPWSDSFVTLFTTHTHENVVTQKLTSYEPGYYVFRSEQGPGSSDFTAQKISDWKILDPRQPIPLSRRQRWIATAQMWHEGKLCPTVFYSDDDGKCWRGKCLTAVEPYQISWPHQGMRWQQYSCEPTVAELSDGRLLLIARTSQDVHYRYWSSDGGETWSNPEPTMFHATTTMPTLLRLGDNRLLFFWCNSQPLPELDHRTQPGLTGDEINGVWEDVFTNRDVCHAAISDDDGKSWRGFRELHLNPIRNRFDFRTCGRSPMLDKSNHQYQALELAEGKVLLSLGQHPESRRMLVFDPDWLLENTRSEDFLHGCDALSTQVYVKSVSGGNRGFTGHCAWNRTNGALMMPDPFDLRQEALQIGRIRDERLLNELQGAVWNFPAATAGKLSIRLFVAGNGVAVTLTDRWFNPCDITAKALSPFSFNAGKEFLHSPDAYADLTIEFDDKQIIVAVNGVTQLRATARFAAPAGFSYLHLQSLAEEPDAQGTYVKALHFEAAKNG